MRRFPNDDLKYFFDPIERVNSNNFKDYLLKHPEIRFVSLVGVDLGNNHTDEKIPIELFLEDIETFIKLGVQTDGSSVYLPEIAELNNAKVDIIPDAGCRWFVDYNHEYLDQNGLPVGTLQIPSYLIHNGECVCSRGILKRATEYVSSRIKEILTSDKFDWSHIIGKDEIKNVHLTMATELEFWVRTPDLNVDIDKLTTSQSLKEQYWKRTVGPVRTALEQSLLFLDKYGFNAEMGHKEVGGISSKLIGKDNFSGIMEQLEIDWKYSDPMSTSDNDLFAKEIIKDVFVSNGLDISFMAKPVDDVAGSGKHTHLGISLELKSGKKINLFHPSDNSHYLSPIGYAALMGILKNYEAINPLITANINSFKRLKPGFEAPVCIVCSLGHDVKVPSRNRSVLVGLVKDTSNPMATRFELRSPNPTSNTYLYSSALYLAMLEGIEWAVDCNRDEDYLLKELSKDALGDGDYLLKNRVYRSEWDVFEHYTQAERDELFGVPPKTIYENLVNLSMPRCSFMLKGNVWSEKLLQSYKSTVLDTWCKELKSRVIDENRDTARTYKKLHDTSQDVSDLDVVNWSKIHDLRYHLMKDSLDTKSLFSMISDEIGRRDYEAISKLQLEMDEKMGKLRGLYSAYRKNMI